MDPSLFYHIASGGSTSMSPSYVVFREFHGSAAISEMANPGRHGLEDEFPLNKKVT